MTTPVKHLRSATANKRPAASGMTDGRLAINTASGTPGLYFVNNASGVVKVGPAHVGAAAPNATPAGSAGNSLGELWVNNSTTINGLNYFTGSAFVNLTPSGTTTVAGLVELATDAETQTGTDTVRAVTPSGLQSKVSNSISTTSSTTIASATAVKTAYDLANAALPKSGGRVTGELEIGPAGSLVFEGSTDDGFETTIAVVNPTADRTVTFPNVTGTVVTTGDTGSVTSAMILDGTIVNADVNASAAIALSKLATGALPSGITVNSANIVDATIVNADISNSAGIAYSKLALSSGIVNTDISASASIALSKLATGALPTGITIASGNIVDGTIVNADVSASAAIADTKLATISTAGKVSGTAITSGTIATSGALQITSTAPLVDLTESDGTATFSRTRIIRDSDAYRIQTRSSANVAVSTDYLISVNASGATDHIWRIADTEKARLDGTGLTVVDDLTISDKIIHAGDSNTAIRFPAADTFTIETAGSERARVDSSGRLLMGEISPATSVNHSICTPGRLQSDGTYSITTGSSANVFISTEGLFSRSTSSLKYKTDVEDVDINYSEALVYGSRPVWYRSLSESDPSDYSYWGFIAEEVAEIDPRMVHWGDDGPEGVQYDRYVVHLVNVIQRQQQRLDAMESRIAALEA
jgi:hypothetical protein